MKLLLIVLCFTAATLVGAQAPVVRDSAGVRIVQNRARATAPVLFTLAAKARFDVGGLEDDPDHEFNPRQGYLLGAWLSTGGLAVIDEVRMHVFDALGRRQAIVGRKGKGPEEFTYLTSICRTRGDTLAVHDSQSRRMAVLTGNGGAVRTFPQGTMGSPPFSGCFDDGTILMMQSLATAAGEPLRLQLTRVLLDGTKVAGLGEFDAGTFDMVTQSSPSIAASGQRFYFADPRFSEVRIFSVTGKLLSIVRSADIGATISSGDVEERFRRSIPRNTPDAEVTARLDRMRSLPHASRWPTFRQVHVDPTGQLWVQDYTTTSPTPDGWTLFDATGALVGRLVIPAPKRDERPWQVIAFRSNEILVRRRDDDGAAHLTAYPIVRVAR